jgi:two-component system OmpR family sensor kinase
MRWSPWPRSVRGRLAAVAAAGALLIGAATGVLLLASLDAEVDQAVDAGLRTRADDIEASARAGSLELAQEEAYAQITTPDGQVLVSSSTIGAGQRVLTPPETAAAAVIESVFERPAPGLGDHARLLARPVRLGDLEVVIVVGASTVSATRAEEHLRTLVLAATPVLALLVGVAAWWVAGRALRPAERMAGEAESISLVEPGRRLSVPARDHELAHLGGRLNAMLERIEHAYEHERAFLDDASHELRTPLAVLRGELELALRGTGDPQVRAALRAALAETDRLVAITSDLLTLARADSGGLAIEPEPVDVRAACEQARDRVSDGRAVVEIVGAGATAFADPRRVEQILVNLLANACRHAASAVQVTVDDGAFDGWVAVEVADDGEGFPADLLPRAFDRFSRAGDERHRGEGRTGLGLAIVAALADALGGSVSAANGPPLGGAVVTVRLPARP